jgi:hypothetical protein
MLRLLYPEGRSPATCWIGNCVSPRAALRSVVWWWGGAMVFFEARTEDGLSCDCNVPQCLQTSAGIVLKVSHDHVPPN